MTSHSVSASDAPEHSLHSDAAFGALFERHLALVHRFVTARAGSNDADDIAAEVFLVAYRKRGQFDATIGDARAWLLGIAVNDAPAVVEQHELAHVEAVGVLLIQPGRSQLAHGPQAHDAARRDGWQRPARRPAVRGGHGFCGRRWAGSPDSHRSRIRTLPHTPAPTSGCRRQ